MFFTKGVGKHREKLTSFELALRSAGIAACNLVRVSSIFPPNCRILSRAAGRQAPRARPGHLRRHVRSSHARAAPADRRHRRRRHPARPRALRLPLRAPQLRRERGTSPATTPRSSPPKCSATTLGLEFDPDKSWDEKKEVYRLVERDRARPRTSRRARSATRRPPGRPWLPPLC